MTTQAPDVEVLTPETISSETQSTTAEPASGSRCQHRYQNGKRCRLLGSGPQSGLCPRHFRQRLAAGLPPCDDFADLSADLLPEGTEFSSAEDLCQYLTRLLILMTKGRVGPRRAAVLAYITNQLLHSHVAAVKESADEEPQIIFDLPRPKRDDPVDPETAYYERQAKYKTSGPPAEPDGYDGWTSSLDSSNDQRK